MRGAGRRGRRVGLGLVLALGSAAHAQPPRLEVQEVGATGSMPKGVSLSPDGKTVYVTNFGQHNGRNVTVLDAATLEPKDTIDLQGNVVESVLSPDGRILFVSNFLRNTVQYLDLEKKKVTREVATGAHPKVLALTRDGKTLFAANWSGNTVSQIDVATAAVVRTLPVGAQPRGMVGTRTGKLYVANFNGASIDVFSGADLATRERVPACAIPRHLALSPDEKLLYVSCYHDSMLHALDTETHKVVRQVHVGSSPKSVDVSPDGRFVFTADYGKETNSVSVVDTTDWTARVFVVPGMDRGSGLVVAPDGVHAYVTGWYDNHVYLVGFEGTGGHPKEARAKIDRWIERRHHE